MTLLALLTACHHLGTLPGHGSGEGDTERIAVTPDHLDFPVVSVNRQGAATLTFRITNLGDAEVTVSGHDEVGGGTPFAVDAAPLLTLAEGEERDVAVTFTPPTDGTWTVDLVVEPGQEVIELAGTGTAPVLRTGTAAFDPVVLGCEGHGSVEVHNDGAEALEFLDAHLTSDEFRVVGLPDALGPGESDRVDITFTPAGSGSRATSLVLTTNDPLSPEVAVPVSALGYEGERVTESFHYAPSNPTDIVFVVDTGASMADWLAPAEAAIRTFVSAIRSTNVDYHVTALGSAESCPGTTPGFATRTDTSLQTEVVVERGFLAGPGPWEDDLLGLALAALDASATGGCLEGFRRSSADLHVIAVTDGPASADLAARISTLAARAEGDAGFRLSGMFPLTGCGTGSAAWEEQADTTGGSAGDVCAPDWTADFADFAALPPGADPVTYFLAELPVPTSVAVQVEGVPFESWSYDAAQNAVVFDGDAIPALGAEVTLEYVLAVACAG